MNLGYLMGIEQLLATLGTIEAVPKETIAAIRKAYEQANRESEAWKKRADASEASVNRLNELLGGESGDAKKAVEMMQQQIKDLTTDRDRHKTEAETLKADIKRTQKLDQLGAIASKMNIDRDGFAAMIKGGMIPEDKILVEGEEDKATIKVEGKDLKDYLKSYPYLERALIVVPTAPDNGQEPAANSSTTPTPTAPPLTPTGGTNGTNSKVDPTLNAIVELGFAVPKLTR